MSIKTKTSSTTKSKQTLQDKYRAENNYMWDHVSLPRRAQRSCALIMQTEDWIAMKAFRKPAYNGEKEGTRTAEWYTELFKSEEKIGTDEEYKAVYNYDMQRREVHNLVNGARMDWDNPLKEIDNALTSGPNIAIIGYIYTKAHADEISDTLVAIAQDEKAFTYKSTVICFTSSLQLFDQTLRGICYSFRIPSSTEAERWEIGNKTTTDINAGYQQRYGEKLNLNMTQDLVSASRGLNKQQVQTAMIMGYYKDRTIKVEHFTELKTNLVASRNLQYVEPHDGFETIGGYDLLKQYIRSHIIAPLRDPIKAAKYGLGIPKGVIFYGPPGTGKTAITKATAKELGLSMIKLSSSDVMRGFVGESEQRQRDITDLMDELAPNVVDAEEVEQLCPDRAKVMMTDSGVSRRITNGWLDWLSSKNRKSLVIGNTNFLSDLDPAFYRPGRIDEIILVLPPDSDAREAIFNVHTKIVRQMPLDKDFNTATLAEKTYMWNGAEIEQACIDAGHKAFDENTETVSMGHFLSAINDHVVNEKLRAEDIKNVIEKLKGTQRYNESFLQQATQAFQAGSRKAPEADKVAHLFD